MIKNSKCSCLKSTNLIHISNQHLKFYNILEKYENTVFHTKEFCIVFLKQNISNIKAYKIFSNNFTSNKFFLFFRFHFIFFAHIFFLSSEVRLNAHLFKFITVWIHFDVIVCNSKSMNFLTFKYVLTCLVTREHWMICLKNKRERKTQKSKKWILWEWRQVILKCTGCPSRNWTEFLFVHDFTRLKRFMWLS